MNSLMSISMSGQSNASSSPVSRRHSVTSEFLLNLDKSNLNIFVTSNLKFINLTASQPGQVEELNIFKNRKTPIRRSARTGNMKGPLDPKGNNITIHDMEGLYETFLHI